MIQLHPDCLIFKTESGELIPCSAETVTIELIGEAVGQLDPRLVQNAAEAVVHYFKVELDRPVVSVAEFSAALEKVLNSLGLNVTSPNDFLKSKKIFVSDLAKIAATAGDASELVFFTQLRAELRKLLANSPELLRFQGLRGCAKKLAGSKKWNPRCQDLSDQIVIYLRACLTAEGNVSCGLIIR